MDYETIRDLALHELEQEGEFSDPEQLDRYIDRNEQQVINDYCNEHDIDLEE